MNELALWRLESPDPEYDEVLLPVLLRSGYCRGLADKSYFSQIATLLQDVPPDKRELVLSGERKLLARWGTARPNLPERPVPSLRDREEGVLAVMRGASESVGPALSPVLATHLLVNQDSDLSPSVTCALHQWGLRQMLTARDAERGVALTSYRYAMAPTAAGWMPMSSADLERSRSSPPGAYPVVASKYGVEGTVTLRVSIDAEGRYKGASVIGREIRVAGVPGRPVAFETLLDQPSIARASTRTYAKPDPAQVRDGTLSAVLQMGWKLE